MVICDFVIRYDPLKDKQEDLTKRIFYSLFIKRCKANKPTISMITGESGEGKSWCYLRMMEIFCEILGIDVLKFIDVMNVYTPLQYPQKIDKLLFDKEYKKVNMIALHEAREIVKAKNWHSFLAQAVGDINAMSRSVKRLMIFIISQFIRDVTSDVRHTIKYYGKVSRPIGRNTRLRLYVMWKDDRDPDKPKLRKRKVTGFVVYPNGKYRRFTPGFFIMRKPSKEVYDLFEKQDYESKAKVIKRKLNDLLKDIKSDIGDTSNKIEAMVKYYSETNERLCTIGKSTKKGFQTNKAFKEMHDLTKPELKEFESALNNQLTKIGVIEDV